MRKKGEWCPPNVLSSDFAGDNTVSCKSVDGSFLLHSAFKSVTSRL